MSLFKKKEEAVDPNLITLQLTKDEINLMRECMKRTEVPDE